MRVANALVLSGEPFHLADKKESIQAIEAEIKLNAAILRPGQGPFTALILFISAILRFIIVSILGLLALILGLGIFYYNHYSIDYLFADNQT